MSAKYVMQGDVKVMEGTRSYELLTSGKPEDLKTAKRLGEFTRKCYDAGYEYAAVQKLRQEYKDVV